MSLGGSTLVARLERCYTCTCATRRSASTYSAITRGIHRRQPELGSRPPAASRPSYENGEQDDNVEYLSRQARDREFFKQRDRLRPWERRSDRPRYADGDDRSTRDTNSKAQYDEREAINEDVDLSDQPSRRQKGYDAHSYFQADDQRYIDLIKKQAGIGVPEDKPKRGWHKDPEWLREVNVNRRKKPTSADWRATREKWEPNIEYTTPASEFLYGTTAILAALKSERRKPYKLYVRGTEDTEEAVGELPDHVRDSAISKAARLRNIQVIVLIGWKTRLLDKMSKGGAHDGYVLETSPIARRPIECLDAVKTPPTDLTLKRTFPFTPAPQSAEEAEINGTDHEIVYGQDSRMPRYPFLLMVDGVVNTGNVGAVIRTAFFLGADAVVLSTNAGALTSATHKTAAGAAESMPLFNVHNTTAFVRRSQANGWRFFASVAPSTPSHGTPSRHSVPHYSASNLGAPLLESPCVLMLGSETTGLPDYLVRTADCKISIEGDRSGQGGVDSLNVSVAAGILAVSFLRPPDVIPKISHDVDDQAGNENKRTAGVADEKLW